MVLRSPCFLFGAQTPCLHLEIAEPLKYYRGINTILGFLIMFIVYRAPTPYSNYYVRSLKLNLSVTPLTTCRLLASFSAE